MKYFNFWALALVAIVMAACSSEDELTQSPPAPVEEDPQVPIIFSSNKGNTTRAGEITGSAAADLLGKKFVVTGYKGSQSTWADGSSIVFDNYVVEYAENTAFTTESNVANWEYVGKGLIKPAQDKGITRQTIKYWDYTKAQYDFIAWSTGNKTAIYEGTPGDGQVLVSAITPETATGEWPTTGDTHPVAYTFTGKATDLQECYISDMVTILKKDYSSKTGENPVTLTFRSLGTKVRIGIYETIPGYSVRDVKFYTKGGLLTKTENVLDAGQIVDNATLFTTSAGDIYTEGTYTVYFPTVDKTSTDANYADNNQAHVKFSPKTGVTQSNIVDWGGLSYTDREEGEKTTGAKWLGRSSNTASFAGDASKNYYVVYMPNETGTNLNLRVDFTMESIDGSGEIIEVKNAKAQIPSVYTQWKSGFAYTYLFKISDKTNGRTGVYDPTQADDATVNSDPAGLYPITFDAMVVDDETTEKTQETITLVSTPSITTYQQNSTVVNANEYTANGKDIFVTVNEGDALVTMTTEDADKNAALYIIPAGKTEAEVVDALQMQDDNADENTIKGRSGLVLTKATKVAEAANIDAANKYALTNSVEFGADGNAISVAANQALRFKPQSNKTYAFVYTKTAADPAQNKVMYEPVAFATTGITKYRYGYKNPTATDAQKGAIYFSVNGTTYTKVTAFIGQGVGNLYTRSGEDPDYTYTKASGYAVTGTDYYYTLDEGQTYIKATNIAYADFATATLYKNPAKTVTKTETTPVDGQAYYDADGKYCVILPQQTTGWKQLDTATYVVADEAAAVDGQTYFDKFTKNDGVYYVKVIKVQ